MKTDDRGRLLLTTNGTRSDLEKYGMVLRDGLEVDFYTDDADDSGARDDILSLAGCITTKTSAPGSPTSTGQGAGTPPTLRTMSDH